MHKKKTFVACAKILLAVAILYYLIVQLLDQAGLERLVNGTKNWGALAVAQGLIIFAFSLNFVRWFLLVRGLRLPFHLREAFRLGSLGVMLSQVTLGTVGGDLVKALFLAREQPGHRTEAMATVVIDRIVGLFAMFLVTSAGLATVSRTGEVSAIIRSMQVVVWTASLMGAVAFVFLLSPLATGVAVRKLVDRVPLVGHTLHRLVDAVEMYRTHRRYVFTALGVGITTHCVFIVAFWCISVGLPITRPTFLENCWIAPTTLVAGAIPITPGGLGTRELALEELYKLTGSAEGDGTLVALAYRAMTYVLAIIGLCYYVTSRRTVDRVIHEADELAEEL